MTEKKTLKLLAPSEQAAPAIKKKGRGWEISEKRLDALHERARDMRRHPTPAHQALADKFATGNLGKYSFKRQAVIGSAIVDFGCHNLGMAIAIDEDDGSPIDSRRDKSLEAVGIRVMRIKASDILEDIDTVLERIGAGMRMQATTKRAAAHAHRAANPRQDYPRTRAPSRGAKRSDNARD
jgi:very-short-patch-repair endonuclease